MKKIFRVVIMLPVIFLIIGMTAYAQDKMQCRGNGPDRILHIKIKQILEVLENKALSEKTKEIKLQAIVDPIFNYPLMAKLTLGRKYWPELTKAQQAVFTDLFIKRLKESYFNKISLYSGNVNAEVVCQGVEPAGKKAVVPVTVTAKGTTIGLRYYFYRFPDGWKVYDVEIQGVSIVSSYRAQFEQVLSHGTINDLVDALKAPLPAKTEKAAETTKAESDAPR